MAEVTSAISTSTEMMRYHAPSRFETVVVFAPGTTVLQVMAAVLRDYIERFDINVVYWEAGPRPEDEPEKRPGRPKEADLANLPSENIMAGLFRGEFEDAFAFAGAQILAQGGSADDDSYGYTDTVSLCLGSDDLSGDATPDRIRRVIDSHHALVRALIARFPVLRAHIYRSSNIYAPAPPHSEAHYLLYIAHRADIAQSYDNPEDYWRAWDTVEPLDANRVLVTRALNIDDELEFKAHVYPRIWQLARLARPKQTRYAMPNVREHDKPYYYGPDDVTSPVGYYPPEQWVEFTAFPQKMATSCRATSTISADGCARKRWMTASR